MQVDSEVQRQFDKAKYALIRDKKSVFMATILFSLRHIWDDTQPTLCTDGINLYINPDFFMSLSPNLRISALAHESWHVAFKHMLRLGTKNPKIWNYACDFYINLMLRKAGYEIDPNWCCDAKYDHMSVIDIYNQLMKDAEQQQQNGMGVATPGSGLGSGEPDMQQPKDDSGKKLPDDAAEAKINSTLVKAATAAKLSGHGSHIPHELLQELEMITNPPLNWNTIFQNILSSYSKDDFSYRRPNRRFLPDFYLPSLYSESYGEVIFGFDTSGSMTDEQCASFIGHLHYVQTYIKPEKITIFAFDTKIRSTHVFEKGDDLRKLDFKGRGGTDLNDLFDKATELNPRLLVVYSDLDCYPITKPTPFPVVWLCADNKYATVEFGTLIHIDTTRR